MSTNTVTVFQAAGFKTKKLFVFSSKCLDIPSH